MTFCKQGSCAVLHFALQTALGLQIWERSQKPDGATNKGITRVCFQMHIIKHLLPCTALQLGLPRGSCSNSPNAPFHSRKRSNHSPVEQLLFMEGLPSPLSVIPTGDPSVHPIPLPSFHQCSLFSVENSWPPPHVHCFTWADMLAF